MKKIQYKRVKSEEVILAHYWLENLPPTTNTVYSKRRGSGKGMFLNAKGKAYKEKVIDFVDKEKLILPENTLLEIQVGYFVVDGAAYQEAQLLKFDVEGRHKVLIDGIIESCNKRCNVDDSWFIKATFTKHIISETIHKGKYMVNMTEVVIKSVKFELESSNENNYY